MNTRIDEFDDDEGPAVHGIGVRTPSTNLLTYELAVIGLDVAEVVRAAGGWICDRVRAGWRVSVLVPTGSDTRPLQILGVKALCLENDYDLA